MVALGRREGGKGREREDRGRVGEEEEEKEWVEGRVGAECESQHDVTDSRREEL